MKQANTLALEKKGKQVSFLQWFFFALIAFLSVAGLQYYDSISLWLTVCTGLVLVLAILLFFAGFPLKKNKLEDGYALGKYTVYGFFLGSLQLLFVANILYMVHESAGRIMEDVNFLVVSIALYAGSTIVLSAIIYILASPKRLFKKIKNDKTLISALISGVLLMVVYFVIMFFLQGILFSQPDSVKDPYWFLVIAGGMGFVSVSLLILMKRAKESEV